MVSLKKISNEHPTKMWPSINHCAIVFNVVRNHFQFIRRFSIFLAKILIFPIKWWVRWIERDQCALLIIEKSWNHRGWLIFFKIFPMIFDENVPSFYGNKMGKRYSKFCQDNVDISSCVFFVKYCPISPQRHDGIVIDKSIGSSSCARNTNFPDE